MNDFEVSKPLRVFNQKEYDQCTSCALASIAEDKLGVKVDSDYIYQNSKKLETLTDYVLNLIRVFFRKDFGITPERAIRAVLKHGVMLEDTKEIVFPFRTAKQISPNDIAITMFETKQPIFCGLYWQPEWGEGNNVCYYKEPVYKFMPHAVKAFGVKNNGVIINIEILNSMGENSGDKGVWIVPPETKFNFAYKLT